MVETLLWKPLSKKALIQSIFLLLAAILVLTLPLLTTKALYLHIAIMVLIYIPLALSQNIITGFTGMLTMGQAAFYGIGAYTSALLMIRLDLPWLVAFLAAGAFAGIFGFVVGFPCLRVGSDYLTLMTIGFGSIFLSVVTNWVELTRGSMGLPGVPSPSIGPFAINSLPRQYYLYLVIVVVCYIFMHRVTKSRIGRALIAIREDEIAASTLGVNLAYYKVMAFVLGAMWAGFSGSMLAHFLNFVGPQSFTLDESLLHMQIAILGGFGSLAGSVIGAVIMISIPEIFRDIYEYRMLLYGITLLILMAWRPQGIMGTSAISSASGFGFLEKWRQFLFHRRADVSESTAVPSVDTLKE